MAPMREAHSANGATRRKWDWANSYNHLFRRYLDRAGHHIRRLLDLLYRDIRVSIGGRPWLVARNDHGIFHRVALAACCDWYRCASRGSF